jgi:hypothetical protein
MQGKRRDNAEAQSAQSRAESRCANSNWHLGILKKLSCVQFPAIRTYQELAAADWESRHDGFKFTHGVRKE